jgi:DNA uptake protein ComE-like DNA-binding protein
MKRSLSTLLGLLLTLGVAGSGRAAAPAAAPAPTTKKAIRPMGLAKKPHRTKVEKLGSTVIDINAASAAELQRIPGIGKARARKIMKARPFQSVDDLVTKKILTKKELDKVRNNLEAK